MTDGAGYAYLYDKEGNRQFRFVDNDTSNTITSGDTDITEYEWDHRNRLVKITHYADEDDYSTTTPDKIIEYAYDHGNRWTRKILDNGADGVDSSTIFVHDGNDIALQFDHTSTGDATAGDLSHRYLHNPGSDEVLADETADGGGARKGDILLI